MKILKPMISAAALVLAGCGGPVPPGMFLTMSVSAYDAAVETSINGKPNELLSGGSGSMTSSMPINRLVREGKNEIVFVLTPLEGDDLAPGFVATLEVSLKGEMVDTLAPGERAVFARELNEAETAALARGETVTITESVTVDKAALKAMKSGAD